MKTLSIIGAGRVGQTLARVWHQQAVFRIGQVMNRSLASTAHALTVIGAGTAASWPDLQPADIWMLSVADDQISQTVTQLVAGAVLRPGDVVFHCSGAKASLLLAPAAQAGACTASLHPVRSFADPVQVAADFAGTICSLEGDVQALTLLETALQAVAAHTVRIEAEHKLVYHAAAVMASNYLVTLMDTVLATYQAAGIPLEMAQAMAAPLARLSLENVFSLGAERALTGPIARGDMVLVEQQAAALKQALPEAGALYQALIAPTQALAARRIHSEK
ncbi:Rossmann-like and DUF2520 domain-containing protein [Undibacterium rugosum]|uniref:Rossmann-like and DUF2520 domain-containing protein n=1 Tax=Undibacterium rugosum TaxID=2762291 RepID=UPI001B82E8C7|nr:DUF2520 domain-containing protein [Undibacterium rugosum]MBR7779517.1 DUF2520 domain-containing protein [Undibacterium rugosum]